jgi:hypothetical protein
VHQLKSGTRDFEFLGTDFWSDESCRQLLDAFAPKLSLLVSGFMPRDLTLAKELLAEPIALCPTFHVYGEGDTLVDKSRTIELANCFALSPTLFAHPGGHMVPTGSGTYKTELLKFFDEIQ